MRRIMIIFLLLFVACASAGLVDNAEKAFIKFNPELDFEFEKYTMSPQEKDTIEQQSGQAFLQDFVYLWTVTKDQNFYGYAIADAVRGRSAFITALILIKKNGAVAWIDILNYRGMYGRETTSRDWLQQFSGATLESELTPGGSVIDAMTGATRSANAISQGVKRWLLLAEVLVEKRL